MPAGALVTRELGAQRFGHLAGELLLESKQIGHRTREPLSPELRFCCDLDEFRLHAQGVPLYEHAAGYEMGRIELDAQCPGIDRAAFVTEDHRPGDDA